MTMESCEDRANFQMDSGRGCRSKRKSERICCPVCCITLRVTEVQSHYDIEMYKLHKISSRSSSCTRRKARHSLEKKWEIYQKVRCNREKRLRSKITRRKAIMCPICNKEPEGDITVHVDECLKTAQNHTGSDEESVDVEAFEEYEWAGQSRVRITTCIPGGVVNLGTQITMAEDNEDLNVDGDDTQAYGCAQYTEKDIILLPSEPEDIALREAVMGKNLEQQEQLTSNITNTSIEIDGDPVVEVLKNRIRELESRANRNDMYKCLICMDRYHVPVISVSCWHVHCENCWLQTLGAKKLCPQCNMITSPSDLRKIYM